MKIFKVDQIRSWDTFSIQKEKITSLELMERAADAFLSVFLEKSSFTATKSVHVFCGQGNNGGDGLVIARKLSELTTGNVFVYRIPIPAVPSAEFSENFIRLPSAVAKSCLVIDCPSMMPTMKHDDLVVDAILGVGFRGPTEGLLEAIVDRLIESSADIWSVDLPTGMSADHFTNWKTIHADHTISFELPKLAFFLPENLFRLGKLQVVSIGLSKEYYEYSDSRYYCTTITGVRKLLKKRKSDSHKGTYGHSLIVAGSSGKVGAAVLCTRACMRAGAGLVTALVPTCGYDIMQVSAPEVMIITDANHKIITKLPSLEIYSSVAIGPGIGTAKETLEVLKMLLKKHPHLPLVLDADALNLLCLHNDLLKKIPAQTILTPHIGEFERLFGKCSNSFERLNLQREKSIEYRLIIVLKGPGTSISLPDGSVHFNTTGNPGMATGGSGDVLTGIISGLLAQKYDAESAAILGVYLHGLSGDICKAETGEEALIASDLISNLGKAFKAIYAEVV
jgi:NAD(P)H-hydrate epimerase